MRATFKDPYSVCCTDCKFDYSRSIRKAIRLKFSYNEQTFVDDGTGTFVVRNIADASGQNGIE